MVKDGLAFLGEIESSKLGASDYSLLVAPFAKAYEGFLKDLFLKLNLISQSEYASDHFRVGKVLNPNLKQKRFSLYSRLESLTGRKSRTVRDLWQAWKLGRNQVFHYFPHNLNKLTLNEAKVRIGIILSAIESGSALLDNKRAFGDNRQYDSKD